MKTEKVYFILSILGILILMFLSQITATQHIGTVESIQYSNNKITIKIKNNPIELILFETNSVDIKKGDVIEFTGKSEVYKNKKQIIIEKIYLSR